MDLDFGDVCFAGNGEFGECLVGCERKRLTDLINSMKYRRLSGSQLRGMWQVYDYVFVIAEGLWKCGAGGEIVEPRWNPQSKKREWMPAVDSVSRTAVSYKQLMSFLFSLQLRSRSKVGEPLRVIRTSTVEETAAAVVALYSNFTEKRWDQHHAHDQIYTDFTMPNKGHGSAWAAPHTHDEDFGEGGVGTGQPGGRAGLRQKVPTTVWRMAAQLPGVDRRAEAVAEYFKTVRAMAQATEKEWEEVPGIGKKTAAAAVRAITEEGA